MSKILKLTLLTFICILVAGMALSLDIRSSEDLEYFSDGELLFAVDNQTGEVDILGELEMNSNDINSPGLVDGVDISDPGNAIFIEDERYVIGENAIGPFELDENEEFDLTWENLAINQTDVDPGDVNLASLSSGEAIQGGTYTGINPVTFEIDYNDIGDLEEEGLISSGAVGDTEIMNDEQINLLELDVEEGISAGSSLIVDSGSDGSQGSGLEVDEVGNLWLGGEITFPGVFNSDINPGEDSNFDLGDENNRWASIHISEEISGQSIVSSDELEDDSVTSDELDEFDNYDISWENLEIFRDDVDPEDVGLEALSSGESIIGDHYDGTGEIIWNVNWQDASSLTEEGAVDDDQISDQELQNTDDFNLGSVSINQGTLEVGGGASSPGDPGFTVNQDGDVIFGGNLTFSGNLTVSEGQVIEGDFLPESDQAFNLGSQDLRWSEVFISDDILGTDLIQAEQISSSAVTQSEISSNSVGTTELIETDSYDLDWDNLEIQREDVEPEEVGLENLEPGNFIEGSSYDGTTTRSFDADADSILGSGSDISDGGSIDWENADGLNSDGLPDDFTLASDLTTGGSIGSNAVSSGNIMTDEVTATELDQSDNYNDLSWSNLGIDESNVDPGDVDLEALSAGEGLDGFEYDGQNSRTWDVIWGDASGLDSSGDPNEFGNANDLTSLGNIRSGVVGSSEIATGSVGLSELDQSFDQSDLLNSDDITVNSGSHLNSGGTVSLGDSITLNVNENSIFIDANDLDSSGSLDPSTDVDMNSNSVENAESVEAGEMSADTVEAQDSFKLPVGENAY